MSIAQVMSLLDDILAISNSAGVSSQERIQQIRFAVRQAQQDLEHDLDCHLHEQASAQLRQ